MVISGCGEKSVETWTPDQRKAKRDLVVEGKIKHVKNGKRRYKNLGGAETWGGVIEVSAKLKGEADYEKGDTFPFWFEQGLPVEGSQGREGRTPPFPKLKGGDTGTFYLTLMSPEDKERMGAAPSKFNLYMIATSYDFVPKESSAE